MFATCLTTISCLPFFRTLKMEAYPSEMLVLSTDYMVLYLRNFNYRCSETFNAYVKYVFITLNQLVIYLSYAN
jgi:hypothetical protein